MNPFEFVIVIVLIVTVGQIVRYRMGDKTAFQKGRRHGRFHTVMDDGRDDAETDRLRDEVKQLKERIHVLERIAVDKEDTLSRQIDELRNR